MSADDTALTQYIDNDRLREDIKIDQNDLSSGMQNHASLYVHYAQQAVRARRQFERWKQALEVLEARLDGECRKALAEEGGKVTEAMVKAAVLQNATYKACAARVIDAQQEFKMAEIAERAFDQRKDMLLQLARDQAREREGQLRLGLNTATPAGQAPARERATEALSRLRASEAAAA